jgi:Asp-tRNA(Asn)/Glu-tRNA(Gln) amidotransferase C subunit
MADNISNTDELRQRFSELGFDLTDEELARVVPGIVSIHQMVEKLREIDASAYEPASVFSPESAGKESGK